METDKKVKNVALVTGGARRVGKGICEGLHKEGYNIVIHCNSSTADAKELRDALNRKRDNSVYVIQLDLSTDIVSTSSKLVEKSVEKWGHLDLLVNNASNFCVTDFKDMTEEEWNSSLDVNLKAPVFLMKAAATFLKARGGSIVNMGDLVGERPQTSHFSHTISKGSLITATHNAALALAPEVRVNCISPGCVLWPDVSPEFYDKDEYKQWISKTPLKRMGTPEDVANLVIFLSCTSKAGFITGQNIMLDGGRGLMF